MMTFSYDKRKFDPPAPECTVKISAPFPKKIGLMPDLSVTLIMQVDTGADITVVPTSVIAKLQKILGEKLDWSFSDAIGVNGQKTVSRLYLISLTIEQAGQEETHTLYVLALDDESLLGRDVLNKYKVCFNGRELFWTLQ